MFAGSGKKGSSNGFGAKARFSGPIGIALDHRTGTLFVSDFFNHLIRKITPEGMLIFRFNIKTLDNKTQTLMQSSGEVSTLAGSEEGGFAEGRGHAAKFNQPWGICFDEADQSLVLCDNGNSRLRRAQLNGT